MSNTEQVGRAAESSDSLDYAARIGLLAYGLVHLVLAWLAIELAFGDAGGKSASTQGAMNELAQQPLGKVLVWAVAAGMFLLVVWMLVEAAFGHRDEDGTKRLGKRLGSAGKAVIYAVIGASAVKVAVGSGSSGGGSHTMTAKLLDLPAGPWLVGLVGLVVIGVGGGMAWGGLSGKYAKHLDAEGRTGDSGKAYLLFGKIGYIAKGISVGLVGGLFVYAGVTHDPKKSGGLDQALHKVLQQPYGAVLLVAIGVGLACFGLFTFARARHLAR
jgi:hypothetical protein